MNWIYLWSRMLWGSMTSFIVTCIKLYHYPISPMLRSNQILGRISPFYLPAIWLDLHWDVRRRDNICCRLSVSIILCLLEHTFKFFLLQHCDAEILVAIDDFCCHSDSHSRRLQKGFKVARSCDRERLELHFINEDSRRRNFVSIAYCLVGSDNNIDDM